MEGGIIYGGDFLSEILILHVDSAGEDLYKKLVEVIKESGHNIQKVAIESCLPLQFDNLPSATRQNLRKVVQMENVSKQENLSLLCRNPLWIIRQTDY